MAIPTDFQTYTKKEIRGAVLRAFGGYVEDISSANSTSIVTTEMEFRLGSDASGKGMLVYLPDQASNAESRWQVTSWDDSLGDATVDTMGETPSADETVEFYLRGDPGPDDINSAINEVMRSHHRTVYTVIPTRDHARRYDLGRFDWIERPDQVTGMYWRLSPNLLTNSGFELWGGGNASAPSEWTLNGSGASVARATGRLDGFAAKITQSGAVSYLEQDLTPVLEDLRGTYGAAAFTNPLTVTLGAWGSTSSASVGRVTIDDGPSSSNASTLHTGGGAQEFISVSHTLSTTAYRLLARVEVITTGSTNVTWDDAVMVEGSSIDVLDIEHGDNHYTLHDLRKAQVTSEGSRPFLRLPLPIPRRNQIVIASRQPYYTLTTEAATTDMPLGAAVALTMKRLLENLDPGKEQTRYDRLRQQYFPKAWYWADTLAEEKAPDTVIPMVVTGAR